MIRFPLEDFPGPILIKATLATEDRRFYDSFRQSISPATAAPRARPTNAQAGGVRQGGSSITQQLAKETCFLSNERTHRGRKVNEAFSRDLAGNEALQERDF